MRIIDTHQHFWLQDAVTYPWLVPEFGPLYADFGPPDLEPQLEELGVDGTIIVQSSDTYIDTHRMLAQADENEWVLGVVGWVPLRDPTEAARKLDQEWLPHKAFCGIRHLIHEEADPDWILRPDVIGGLSVLAERGVPFDVVAVFPGHLRHVPAISEKVPNLRMVVDHLAKPPIGSGDLSVWEGELRAAAESPNVFAKVSGLNTAVGREVWDFSDLAPSIEIAVDAFGPERLMFGSDWPVAILAGTYRSVLHETVAALDAIGLDPADQQAIFADTASRFYGRGSGR